VAAAKPPGVADAVAGVERAAVGAVRHSRLAVTRDRGQWQAGCLFATGIICWWAARGRWCLLLCVKRQASSTLMPVIGLTKILTSFVFSCILGIRTIN